MVAVGRVLGKVRAVVQRERRAWLGLGPRLGLGLGLGFGLGFGLGLGLSLGLGLG